MRIEGGPPWTGLFALAVMLTASACAPSHEDQVARGRYLVSVIGCSDCHTPGGLTPKPDASRHLGGADAQFIIPGAGTFTPPNLTPDKATGLGAWTATQIVTAITTGVRPDGRVLGPAMPWQDFKNLSRPDAYAIAAYLQSLPPVSHQVPGPGPSQACVPGAEMCVVASQPPGPQQPH